MYPTFSKIPQVGTSITQYSKSRNTIPFSNEYNTCITNCKHAAKIQTIIQYFFYHFYNSTDCRFYCHNCSQKSKHSNSDCAYCYTDCYTIYYLQIN